MEEAKSKQSNILKIGAIYGIPVILCLVLILALNLTSPLQTGPVGILAVFGLLYMSLTTASYAALYGIAAVVHLFGVNMFYVTRRTYYMTSVVMLWPIFILALNTLGRLETTEVILVTLLVALCCFYVSRRRSVQTG